MIRSDHPLLIQLQGCAAQCNICYHACLQEKEVTSLAKCIELARECADLCSLAASVLTSDSERLGKYLELCAAVCTACAGECEKHVHDHCQKCAHLCRSCADACLSEKRT